MASNKRHRTPSPLPSALPHVETVVKVVQSPPRPSPEHVIICSLPHTGTGAAPFSDYAAYEQHYASVHTNRCLSPGCNRNFPSARYLSLHIAENHDPIAEARKARGDKIYACFVDDCDKLCRDWKKRRSHLVDRHGFPRDYDFLVINDGVEGRTSLLRRPGQHQRSDARSDGREKKGSGSTSTGITRTGATEESPSEAAECEERVGSSGDHVSTVGSRHAAQKRRAGSNVSLSASASRAQMDVLTKSMSSLNFVPPSVRFGRGGARGGLARR